MNVRKMLGMLLSTAMVVSTFSGITLVDVSAKSEGDAITVSADTTDTILTAESENVNWEDGSYFSRQGLSASEAEALEKEYFEKYGKMPTEQSLIEEGDGYLKESVWNNTSMIRGTQAAGNCYVNLYLAKDVWSAYPPSGVSFQFEGETYYFKNMSGLVQTVKNANKSGIPVSVELLLESSGQGYPGLELYDPNAVANYLAKPKGNNYWAANVVNENSKYYRAEVEYLAQLFSREDCHIDNWIIGNEVNMPMSWHFTGTSDATYNTNVYALEYLHVYNAVRHYTDKTRVSFCFDHSWQHNDEGRGISTKDFLNLLVKRINEIQPNVDWTISYHMYPAYLCEAAIWITTAYERLCGRELNPRNDGAEFVDGFNLYVMTNYIKDNYGESHKIMCTEQGFSQYMGEDVQAASLALSYYATKYDPMVEAFIVHVADEGGMQNFSFTNKANIVWQNLDTNPAYVESLVLPTIGISSFAEIIPNYGKEVLKADRSKVQAFVTRIYELGLNRSPDSDGLTYWTEELCSGKTTGAEVAGGFFFSDEMKAKNLSNDEYIKRLYSVMMDRVPDQDGLAYWNGLMANAYGKEGVFRDFVESNEFKGICSNYGIVPGTYQVTGASRNSGLSAFMSRLYTKALGRAYDQDGLNYWCDEILNGYFTVAEVSTTQFFHSREFVEKNLNDTEYIKVLYRTFFDREYDQDGFNYWMEQRAQGMSRDEILYWFGASKEFATIKATYGF